MAGFIEYETGKKRIDKCITNHNNVQHDKPPDIKLTPGLILPHRSTPLQLAELTCAA